jgi:radical SAM-linked protein
MVAMVAEPPRSTNPSTLEVGTATQPAPPLRHQYRLRFRKVDSLRLVSHHDLMHVFERMARRAALPLAHTQGFHPQPRLVFALSLALGIAGNNEVLDLDLTEALDAADLHSRLAAQAPPGLTILSVRKVEGKSSSLVRRAHYRLPLQVESVTESSGAAVPSSANCFTLEEALVQRCQALIEESHLWVERSRPQPRRLDIRPYLSELSVQDGYLALAVWVTPNGTARPEEFARLLGLDPLLEAGVYFERSDLEMMDESSAPLPEINTCAEESTTTGPPDLASAVAPARPTALTPGPMSYDT